MEFETIWANQATRANSPWITTFHMSSSLIILSFVPACLRSTGSGSLASAGLGRIARRATD